MWFWVLISLLVLLIMSVIARTLLRGRDAGEVEASFDMQVYRDQLSGVARDLERGVVSPEEAARIKVEVSRRLLEADKSVRASADVTRAPKFATYAAIAVMAAVFVGGVGVYQWIGHPGYADLPLKLRIQNAEEQRRTRPNQAAVEATIPPMINEVEPRHKALVDRLRVAVAEHPNDLKGQHLLVTNEAALGNYIAAYQAQIRVIEIKGDHAKAQDLSELAEWMIIAAGGYVSPEAESALKRALERDPNEGKARYYSGLMFYQNGRPDMAFKLWRQLLDRSAPSDPWIGPIRGQIEDAAAWAGVNYTLPELDDAPALAGPDTDAMAAASDMTAEDRQAMIGNMVAQLSDRLATEGGTPQEWAQLIGALGVLGDVDRARAIWTEAQDVFAADASGLAMVQAAAQKVGIAQ